MFLMAAAALAAAAPAEAGSQPARPTAQARATVRVLSGVRVRFEDAEQAGTPPLRNATVHGDGTPQPAKLVEFE
jgi:hypothetical protein